MSLTSRMTCPRCAAAEISPLTGKCDLCGYAPAAPVSVEPADAVTELATRELAHEFTLGPVAMRGGDWAAFRAKEVGSGRKLVVNVVLRRTHDPEATESFRATMVAFSGLDHPHIVPIQRYGSTDSLFWYAIDDRGASSLRATLREAGPMDLRAVRRILTQLVSALEYLHRRGLVHGGVRPESVLLDAHGWLGLTDPCFTRPRFRRPARGTPPGQPRITPAAGLPRATPADGIPVVPTDAERRAEGREPWVAPEEYLRGERLPAADQYALAVLAVECLTGRPFTGAPHQTLAESRSDIPVRLVRALDRALSAVPTQRFPTCSDFLYAMEEDGVVGVAQPSGRVTFDVVMVRDWEPPPDPRAKFLLALKVGAGVVLAAALIATVPTIKDIIAPPAPAGVTSRAAPVPAPSTEPAPIRSRTEPTSPAPTARAAAAGEPTRAPSSQVREPAPRPAAPAPAATEPAATATARIFVNASPWGEVFIDGMSVGNTPRANVALAPGAHTIRVVRDGFVPWERTIRVAAGDTLRFTDIVLTPNP